VGSSKKQSASLARSDSPQKGWERVPSIQAVLQLKSKQPAQAGLFFNLFGNVPLGQNLTKQHRKLRC
jgi:hypothetical protein